MTDEQRKAQEHTPAEATHEQPREERVEDLDVPEEQSGEVKGGLNYSKIKLDY